MYLTHKEEELDRVTEVALNGCHVEMGRNEDGYLRVAVVKESYCKFSSCSRFLTL